MFSNKNVTTNHHHTNTILTFFKKKLTQIHRKWHRSLTCSTSHLKVRWGHSGKIKHGGAIRPASTPSIPAHSLLISCVFFMQTRIYTPVGQSNERRGRISNRVVYSQGQVCVCMQPFVDTPANTQPTSTPRFLSWLHDRLPLMHASAWYLISSLHFQVMLALTYSDLYEHQPSSCCHCGHVLFDLRVMK